MSLSTIEGSHNEIQNRFDIIDRYMQRRDIWPKPSRLVEYQADMINRVVDLWERNNVSKRIR